MSKNINFQETMMQRVLQHPVNCSEKLNLYSFTLAIPYIVLHLVIGVILAVFIDGYTAINEIVGD